MDLQHEDILGQNKAHASYVGQGIWKYEVLETNDQSLVVPNDGISYINSS